MIQAIGTDHNVVGVQHEVVTVGRSFPPPRAELLPHVPAHETMTPTCIHGGCGLAAAGPRSFTLWGLCLCGLSTTR